MKISVDELTEILDGHNRELNGHAQTIRQLREQLREAKKPVEPGQVVLRVRGKVLDGLIEFHENDTIGKLLNDQRITRTALIRALDGA